MVRFIKVGDFLREVSTSSRMKFELAGLTFAGLVVPTALLVSAGVPEQYALTLMLVAILPFQYAVFCSLASPKETPSRQIGSQGGVDERRMDEAHRRTRSP